MSAATKILMGSGGGGVDLPSDDEFDNVSFLSHFDGANNGTNIVYDDGSTSNHTITTAGNVSQGSFGPFARVDGEWSNHFGGGTRGSSHLQTAIQAASSSDFTLDGEYTIEFFVRLNSTANQYFFAIGDTINANDMELGLLSGTTLRLYQGGYKVFSTGSPLTVGVWHHVAVTRNGSDLVTCWVDGTALGATFTVTADADGTATVGASLYNGAFQDSCLGYISNFRILKGTCLYTGNFTAPTSALTAITNTKLLTCQSNQFKDNSASAHVITKNMTGGGLNPSISAFTPILTSKGYDTAVNGASAFFPGTGSEYLSTADSADWNLGDTFTIEAWVNPYQNEALNTVIEQNGSSGFYYSVVGNPPTSMQFYQGIGSAVTSNSATVTHMNEQWNHVAFVVSGGTGYHYINGVRSGSSASGIDIGDISAALQVGSTGSSTNPYMGAISDVRIVKGTAVYSGTTYTVPTAPLTAITNTKLLLNMADGQANDGAAQSHMTLYGNADISTTQEKFGTASLALDGSGDYVELRRGEASRYNYPKAWTKLFGSSNFTIEAWVYVTDVSAYNCILSIGDPIQFYVKSSTIECYARPLTGSGNFLGPASSISNDTWCHVAMVRNGTSLTAYVNGVGGTPVTFSDAAITEFSGHAVIGLYSPASNLPFAGYIDDLRISHVARYTSNFTPTTEAFPDKGQ